MTAMGWARQRELRIPEQDGVGKSGLYAGQDEKEQSFAYIFSNSFLGPPCWSYSIGDTLLGQSQFMPVILA